MERPKIESVLGKTFADSLDEIVIKSGFLVFTKRQLIEDLGCGNFAAAKRLNKVLHKLKIGTAKELRYTDPFSLLRTTGVGLTTMYVAMCILDFAGVDVQKWWGWKQEKSGGVVLKFSSYKHKAAARALKHKQDIA